MTLIFAGHNLSFDDGKIESTGLFATGDSAITSINSAGSKCTHILSGFKKIYSLDIHVYKPSFTCDYDGGYFTGFHTIHFQHTAFVAIAGGTLVLQHVMNVLNNHMKKLRIVKDDAEYKIIRECQRNTLKDNQGKIHYPSNIYTDNDYTGLNKSETYFKHIEYSIKHSLKSAIPRQITNQSDVARIGFELAVGLYCEINNEYMLKTYICEPKMIEPGEWEFELSVKNIPKDEVVVLGLKNDKERASNLLRDLITQEEYISDNFFALLNTCIDENNSENNDNLRFAISKPSVLYELERNQLLKIKIHNGETVSILHHRIDKRKFKWVPH